MAPSAASPNRSRWCARSPPSTAPTTSAGQAARKTAAGSGRRATTRSMPRSRCAPGSKGWPTDVCVPISKLAECILETQADLQKTRLLAPLVGHVGDGNFHLVYVLDPNNPREIAEAEAFNDRLVRRALSLGGTCTGEHGIGYGKMDFLVAEHGADAVGVMTAIKRALDPKNLMNPGKVVPV
ncbi:MAG: FAD-linked oxidase C-terminal domain-containing protein [Gammaproteobacteria bacterium]